MFSRRCEGNFFDDLQVDAVINSTPAVTKEIPSRFVLYQNYPNPFNPSTTLAFSVPEKSFVSLTVYDLLGREVASVLNSQVNAGRHSVPFDGRKLSSGIYFYKLQSGQFTTIKKMILLK